MIPPFDGIEEISARKKAIDNVFCSPSLRISLMFIFGLESKASFIVVLPFTLCYLA